MSGAPDADVVQYQGGAPTTVRDNTIGNVTHLDALYTLVQFVGRHGGRVEVQHSPDAPPGFRGYVHVTYPRGAVHEVGDDIDRIVAGVREALDI